MGQGATDFPKSLAVVWLPAVCGMVVWSAAALLPFAARLHGKTLLERGFIASNDPENFLARAGRVALREHLERVRARGQPLGSTTANGWVWVAQVADRLPADARIYVNGPSELLYYYGTFFWMPRRVDVNWRPVIVHGGTIVRSSMPVDPERFGSLRDYGYTHVVAQTSQGFRLLELADPIATSRR